MFLEAKDLQVYYNNVILVLRNVSLHVPKGSMVALLGANGAGKSTTLKAISGLLQLENGKITTGKVTFDGKDITGKSAMETTSLGICHVMEGREIFKTLTVEENLKAGYLSPRGKSINFISQKEMVYSYFPPLYERRRLNAGYLSGGEQQMLAIGRALMTNPQMLLLDEPSLGLAPKLSETVFEILAKINKEQKTSILLVEQNINYALTLAEYVYILVNGRVALEGSNELIRSMNVRDVYLGGMAKTG